MCHLRRAPPWSGGHVLEMVVEKPRKILRPKSAYEKCGCGKTKFDEEYRHHSDDDPDVTGAPGVKRVKPIPLGARNIGYSEHEIDALIDGLAKLRDAPKVERTSRGIFTTEIEQTLEGKRDR
jgi:predicted DNA-binding transcriptional regulator AlpA